MKKVLILIIPIVLLLCCTGVTYAEGHSDLNEIISSLETLNEAGNLNSKEGYNLIYLAKEYIEDNSCSTEQIERVNYFSLEYVRQKALSSIQSSVNTSLKCFTTRNGNCKYYDEISWALLEQVYIEAIEKIEGSSEEEIPLIEDDFFEKVQSIPDINTLEREFSNKITTEVERADQALLNQVNLSLAKRNLDTVDFPYKYLYSSDNEKYLEMLNELIAVGYTTDNSLKITKLHEALIDDLIEQGTHAPAEDLEKLTDTFISTLSEVEYITIDATPYLLDNLKLSLIQRLDSLIKSKEIQSLNSSKKKRIDAIYSSTRSNIEGAETIEEAQNALSLGEENILEIAAINDGWISGAMLIGIIISLLLSAIAILWYNKEKKAGRMKYKLLLEEERERIDKATVCDEDPCNGQE